MTTTLRPTGPLRQTDDGAKSRTYEVCVNSRPVGTIELGTDAGFGPASGVIRSLRIDEPDRRRGRGTVAALAAEEVLRGWGCEEVLASVPVSGDAAPALRMTTALGYTERSANMARQLPPEPPELPAGVETRPMEEAEYDGWLAAMSERYAQSWVRRGVTPEQARAKARVAEPLLLPQGLATPGLYLGVLLYEGDTVGSIWVAQREEVPGGPDAYIYDVWVAPDRRGHGFGRALMLLAERVALHSGTSVLGLHVFSDNTPAVRLYESLGYVTTHRHYFKTLF